MRPHLPLGQRGEHEERLRGCGGSPLAGMGGTEADWELYTGVGGVETGAAHQDNCGGCFALKGKRDRQRYWQRWWGPETFYNF